MRIIVITSPVFMTGEAHLITTLLSSGISTVHLRKPGSTYQQCATLLADIPAIYHQHIVIHDHFSLTKQFHLQGIHLNRRNPQAPHDYQGSISCSCHSITEVEQKKHLYNYVLLSPIFDSISKKGYQANFTSEQLKKATEQGIINQKVIALGGLSISNIPLIQNYGFGGAALLGEVWQQALQPKFNDYLKQLVAYQN